jgi:hypothetical protein
MTLHVGQGRFTDSKDLSRRHQRRMRISSSMNTFTTLVKVLELLQRSVFNVLQMKVAENLVFPDDLASGSGFRGNVTRSSKKERNS